MIEGMECEMILLFGLEALASSPPGQSPDAVCTVRKWLVSSSPHDQPFQPVCIGVIISQHSREVIRSTIIETCELF